MHTGALTALLAGVHTISARELAPSLASQYSLTTSTELPSPTATLSSSDAQDYLRDRWPLSRGRTQGGADGLAFVLDPFRTTASTSHPPSPAGTSPVLEATYPAGSYSHETGGAQFFAAWNTSSEPFQAVLLQYDVAFDGAFDWVKGGKLPGLRGGPNGTGCSGGHEPDGSDCFSVRVMWRARAAGEIYAYIPTPNGLCSRSGILCNGGFGTSIQRGSFGFLAGRWNQISLLVRLNSPVNVANGYIALFYNGVQAISQDGLQIRSNHDVNINRLFFSTFFGDSDDSWATPQTVHTYFRNIHMWGGATPPTSLDQPSALLCQR